MSVARRGDKAVVSWALIATALGGLLGPAAAAAQPQAPQPSLVGAWDAREYRLSAGEVYGVAGRIVFTELQWQVLFFVLDDEGAARRGSAEGGTYQADGDRLTFRHELNLSAGDEMAGLPAAPLRMTVRGPADSVAEPARFAIVGDRLEISFPSGNTMSFERSAS